MTQTPLPAVIYIYCPLSHIFSLVVELFILKYVQTHDIYKEILTPISQMLLFYHNALSFSHPHLQTFVNKLQSDVLLSHSTLATLCVLDDALLRWTLFELAWGQPFPWDATASCLTTSSKVTQMLLSSHSHIPCRQLGNIELLPLHWGLWEIRWECVRQVLTTFELTHNSVLPSPSWGTENYEIVSAP